MTRDRVRERTVALLAVGLVLALGSAVTAVAGPEASHSGVVKVAQFEVRYRPGSRAGAHATAVAHGLERDLDVIAKALAIQPKGTWKAYVYDSVEELSLVTGTTGNAGFSSGDTLHIPFDVGQTRLHELVHVVAVTWPASGQDPRGFFEIEGLANAVVEVVDGVHVHAVAADLLRRNELPPIAEMRGDFYAWCRAHPKVRAYDVAGSFVRHLLQAYGPERVRRWYTGTAPRTAFGVDAKELEASWRKLLTAYEIRPEVALLLRQLAGETVTWAPFDGIPADVLGAPEDWTDLTQAPLHAHVPAQWRRDEWGLQGMNDGATWISCELGAKTYGDCAVRVRILTPRPVPVQVRLGAENQIMLVNGVFLYRGEQPVASSQRASMDAQRRETDLLVVRRGDLIRVYVDGRWALDAPATRDEARPGVGLHTGEAQFVVKVRALPAK